jgi:MinD-like ATPase involved in chromosome partitioning or flagellar assembly
MPMIISIHSFRGGTGKSNTVANLSALLAIEGKRVGVIDADIQSPGIHVLFDLDAAAIKFSLNDYLWGNCEIKQAAYDVTPRNNITGPGCIYLIPSSIKAGEITRILRKGYDVGLLNEGFHHLIKELALDALLIDTHPGLNEETLLSIAISDALIIVLRPDQQDYQGTGVTVEVARRLDVPKMLMLVNKTPQVFNPDDVKARVESAYNCKVTAVLPHTDEIMVLASSGIFVLHYPDHPVTLMLKQVLSGLQL